MGYIFLDESGDLGFNFKKIKTSKYFVVTFLFVENKKPVEKIVKKTHSELKKKYKRKTGVLHSVKERPITRQRLLRRLNEVDCAIMAIYLNKKKVYTRLQDEKQVLYNYITNILLDRIYSKRLVTGKNKITIVASRRETSRYLNENFKTYLNNQAKNYHKVEVEAVIRTPFKEKSLQVVDFVSWAIFRKYEYGDESYYNIIRNKIVEENPLFP